MRYCECPFPVFKDALDVNNRSRKKCDRCHCYEDPEEAAENGRPLTATATNDPLMGGSHWQRGVGNYGG